MRYLPLSRLSDNSGQTWPIILVTDKCAPQALILALDHHSAQLNRPKHTADYP
jgi:hypothetical protein